MTDEAMIQQILERLSTFLQREITEADLEQPYYEMGADSMDMVVLAYELEKHLNKEIKPEIFLQYETIREAVDAVLQN